MSNDLLLEQKLRMQLIAGLINESQYYEILEENIFSKIKDRIVAALAGKISKSLSDTAKEELKSFMKSTFGTLKPVLNKENVLILMNKLKLGTVSEAQTDTKSAKDVLARVLNALGTALAFNMSFLNVPVLGILSQTGSLTGDSKGDYIVTYTICAIMLGILTKLVSLLGYEPDIAGEPRKRQ